MKAACTEKGTRLQESMWKEERNQTAGKHAHGSSGRERNRNINSTAECLSALFVDLKLHSNFV